jgi:hypothetical protein
VKAQARDMFLALVLNVLGLILVAQDEIKFQIRKLFHC